MALSKLYPQDLSSNDVSHTLMHLLFRSSEMMVTSVFQFLPTHEFRLCELLVKTGGFITVSQGDCYLSCEILCPSL